MPNPERLLTFARSMRRDPTVAELRLWKLLRGRLLAGLKFRRQVPLGDYIVDFACFDPKLVVEADGISHAASETYDAVRDAWLTDQGFLVLRFTNSEAIFEHDKVAERIRRAAGLV